jgi:hypothetical protein
MALNFKGLGIELKKGEKVNTVELLTEIADAVSAIDDPMRQTATAVKIFGRGGVQMLPMLKAGGKQIAEYAEQVDELGGGFDGAFMKSSKAFREHEKQLTFLARSIKAQISNQLIPILLKWGHAVESMGKAVLGLSKSGVLMRAGWVVGLLAIGAQFKTLIGLVGMFGKSVLLPLIPLLLLGLAVEDLLAWFQGGDSLIGRFFDQFDEGINKTAADVGQAVVAMLDSWDLFFSGVKGGWAYLRSGIEILMTEMGGGLLQFVAALADGIVGILTKPIRMVQKALGFGEMAANFGLEDKVAEDRQQTRRNVGADIEKRLAGDEGLQKIREAMALRKQTAEAEAWKAGGGRTGTTVDVEGKPLAEVGQTAHGPAATGSHNTTTVNDHRTVDVKVDVTGAHPNTVPAKVGHRVAREVQPDYTGALIGSEFEVE